MGRKDRRRFYNLDLEIDNISMLATSWTVVHPISEDSPLLGLNSKDIENRDLELILQLNGYDEIKWNVKFDPILGQGKLILLYLALSSNSRYSMGP